MKIAIATEQNNIAPHFGRCPTYTIVEITDHAVSDREVISNPGHEPGFLPGFLAQMGVSCIIAGGMGMRAQNLFAAQNIRTIIGAVGTVDAVLKKFISGELRSTGNYCDHHDGEHECRK
ncbi:MAG: NifB/NifX family molybdenum-iron cluster-binding protein [Dethiobacteria bacterium]